MVKTLLKKYIDVYLSQEHYEVLGYVKALDIKKAIAHAQKELKSEAKFYEIEEAIIGEIKDEERITFDIN